MTDIRTEIAIILRDFSNLTDTEADHLAGMIAPLVQGAEEYAVQARTIADGPFDRLDTGAWSDRRGSYTREEAEAEVERFNGFVNLRFPGQVGARLVSRTVTDWTPVDSKTAS